MKRFGIIAGVAATLLLLASCGLLSGGGGGPTTINGTLVGILGVPVAGASVTIGSTTVTSDSSGSFSIANVTPPYDVTVSSTANNWAHVFVGVSATSPVLLPAGAIAGGLPPMSQATMAGTILTGTTIDTTHPVEVCLEGVTELVVGCQTLTTSGSYSITANWPSTANVAVKVHALQITLPSAGALPNGYTGYAVSAASTTMVPGNSYTQTLTLGTAPGVASLSGTITTPSGLTTQGLLVLARLSPTFVIPLGQLNLSGTSTAYAATVPTLSGASYIVVALGSNSAGLTAEWKVNLAAGSNRDVTVGGLPTVTAPPSSAGPGDTFTVGNTAGAPLTVVFTPNTSGAGPILAVTTSQSSVTMPSVLPVTSGTVYKWAPVINPAETLDQSTSDWLGGFFSLLGAGGATLDADGGFAYLQSGVPTFTVP